MGHELSMGVSSTRLAQKRHNIFGRLFWNVVLQGHPVQQNGGDHEWLIQTPVSLLNVSLLTVRSLRYSGSEFYTDGPATVKARRQMCHGRLAML